MGTRLGNKNLYPKQPHLRRKINVIPFRSGMPSAQLPSLTFGAKHRLHALEFGQKVFVNTGRRAVNQYSADGFLIEDFGADSSDNGIGIPFVA